MMQTPLLDKKVLIPRGEKQAKTVSRVIEQYGGIPIEIPLIAFRPVELNEKLLDILANVNTYDWMIFTSSVTAEIFFSFMKDKITELPKLAVIGKKTEETLKKMGFEVQFVPANYVAEGFMEEFSRHIQRGTKVLFPKGNLAREYIAASLTKLGAAVQEVVIYETFLPEESRQKLAGMLAEGRLDILMFTSPSTVDHFMEVVLENNLQERLKNCIITSIGPSTEKKLHEYGLMVHASPKEYTVKEMIASTITYLEQS